MENKEIKLVKASIYLEDEGATFLKNLGNN
jgi:hypothetical protein